MKKDTRNQLLNEMKGGEDHDFFAVPEQSGIDLLGENPEFKALTKKIGQKIVKEFAREQYVFGLLEYITKQGNDPIQSIKAFVTRCLKFEDNMWNELFPGLTKSGQEVYENEALARELLNHALGSWGRNKGFTQEQRELLKRELFALNKPYQEVDFFSHFISKMPASLQGASKVELMCKVSIMMLLVAQSHPEQFTKMDEFLEKQVVIDAMLSGKTFSAMIDELLSYSGAFEAKNTGSLYNYRADDLFHFAHIAKDGLAKIPEFLGTNKLTDRMKRQRAKKNDPVLRVFQDWYETVQSNLMVYNKIGLSDEMLYTAYGLYNDLYVSEAFMDREIAYLSDWERYQLNINDILCFLIHLKRKKLKLNALHYIWIERILVGGLPQLEAGIIDVSLEYYHDEPKFFEKILKHQTVTEEQQKILDKKRAEQEKLKNYNERLAIHRQGVRDTFEGNDDGIDDGINRDDVSAFCSNPKNVYTTIDPNTGDISIRLPKCGPKGMKMKLMKTDDFPADNKYIYSEKQFLPKTKSKASQEILYKSELRTQLFREKIDTESQEGYFRDAQRFDTMMYYLGKKFGLGYEPKIMRSNQSVFRVYMALCGRAGRDLLNRSVDGRNGDRWGRVVDGKKLQLAHLRNDRQELICSDSDHFYSSASVILLGDND